MARQVRDHGAYVADLTGLIQYSRLLLAGSAVAKQFHVFLPKVVTTSEIPVLIPLAPRRPLRRFSIQGPPIANSLVLTVIPNPADLAG